MKTRKTSSQMSEEDYNDALARWEDILKVDFYVRPPESPSVWKAVDLLFPMNFIKDGLLLYGLDGMIAPLKNLDPEEQLPQITALFSLLEICYPNQQELIELTKEVKNVNCFVFLQDYIADSFSMHRKKQVYYDFGDLKEFAFSQYSTEKIAAKKAQHILETYTELNDDQAYMLLLSFFGLKYVDKETFERLGILIATAPRYNEHSVLDLPSYEQQLLRSIHPMFISEAAKEKVNGPESEKWYDIEYYEVSTDYEGTRIGGHPTYALQSNKIEWPFGKSPTGSGDLVPLMFLAQIEQVPGEHLYVFLGSAETEGLLGDIDEPFEGHTAVYNSATGKWPSWVEVKEIDSVPENSLWSPEKAASHQDFYPSRPFWLHYVDDAPAGYPDFVYQIPERPFGLPLQKETNTYVFENDEGDAVVFVLYY